MNVVYMIQNPQCETEESSMVKDWRYWIWRLAFEVPRSIFLLSVKFTKKYVFELYIFRADKQDSNFQSESNCSEDSRMDSDSECENENIPPLSSTKPLHKQSVYMVYESQLSLFMKYCTNCGSLIDSSLTTE